ncbi:SUKH-4 family immunity protein [Spirillospora sp. CA-255316]
MAVPELTYAMLTGAFGAEGVERPAVSELPAGVAHGPTRAFLTEVGLPLSVRAMGTMADRVAEWKTLDALHTADPTTFASGVPADPWPDGFAGPWSWIFDDIYHGLWG